MVDGPIASGPSQASLESQRHAQQESSKGGDSGVNEKSTIDAAFGAAEKTGGTLTKAFGANLSELGKVSLTQPVDTEGPVGKTIPSMFNSLNTQGGVLAKLLHDIFIKNREITDHTGGTGGGGATGEGSFGDGGGAGGGGGGDFHFDSSHVAAAFNHMAHDAGGPFDWSPIAWASAGGLPRPVVGPEVPAADMGIGGP